MKALKGNALATAWVCILVSGCGRAPDSATPPAPDVTIPPLGTIHPIVWSAPAGKEAVFRHWRDLFKEHGDMLPGISGTMFVLTLPDGETFGDLASRAILL
jgi:hypothetical protein